MFYLDSIRYLPLPARDYTHEEYNKLIRAIQDTPYIGGIEIPPRGLGVRVSRTISTGNTKCNIPCIWIDVAAGRGLMRIELSVDELKELRRQIDNVILDYYKEEGLWLHHIFEEENIRMSDWMV